MMLAAIRADDDLVIKVRAAVLREAVMGRMAQCGTTIGAGRHAAGKTDSDRRAIEMRAMIGDRLVHRR